jgi:homopolymeric O-antigen transport system permease protein
MNEPRFDRRCLSSRPERQLAAVDQWDPAGITAAKTLLPAAGTTRDCDPSRNASRGAATDPGQIAAMLFPREAFLTAEHAGQSTRLRYGAIGHGFFGSVLARCLSVQDAREPRMKVADEKVTKALGDVRQAFLGPPIWFHLAWQEIKQRYRRSMIGPFWLTISTGVMVCAMGPLYSRLMSQPVGSYFQYLSVSLITWQFMSGCINESCTAFIGSERFIKQIRLPLTTYLLKMIARNLIIFAHNAAILIVVLLIFPPTDAVAMLLAPLGFALVVGNLLWISYVLAVICARFRDIPQIVASIVQILFFLTPIVWRVDPTDLSRPVAELNPFYHLMEVLRAPLLGAYPATLSWAVSGIGALFGSFAALLLFGRFRSRIAYWL